MASTAVIRGQVPHDSDACPLSSIAKSDQSLVATKQGIDMVE